MGIFVNAALYSGYAASSFIYVYRHLLCNPYERRETGSGLPDFFEVRPLAKSSPNGHISSFQSSPILISIIRTYIASAQPLLNHLKQMSYLPHVVATFDK